MECCCWVSQDSKEVLSMAPSSWHAAEWMGLSKQNAQGYRSLHQQCYFIFCIEWLQHVVVLFLLRSTQQLERNATNTKSASCTILSGGMYPSA